MDLLIPFIAISAACCVHVPGVLVWSAVSSGSTALRGCAGATPPTNPLRHLRLMELWVPVRHLLTNSNPNRPTTCRTLHCRHHPSLLICRTYMPKRAIRLTNPKPPHKRSLILIHLYLPTHRTRTLLWLLPLQGNLNTGVILLLTLMATAFVGYVLP